MEPQDLRNGDQEDMDEPQEDQEMDRVQVWIWGTREKTWYKEEKVDIEEAK